MNSLLEKAVNSVGGFITSLNSVSQKKVEADTSGEIDKSNSALLAKAAQEGAVLLKNDGMLPLTNGERISVFGRVQCNWFYTGYGSGGEVNRPYEINLVQGIRECAD